MPTVVDVSLPLDAITPYENNSRVHSDQQVKTLAQMIKRFGFTQPIIIDDANTIIAGYGRYLAAKSIALDTVPCRKIQGISDSEKRALVIADNKIQEQSTWNYDKLISETQSISDIDFGAELNKLLDLTSTAVFDGDSSFKPTLDPIRATGMGVTDEAVQRQQEKLSGQFANSGDQSLAKIVCPFCDEHFTVDVNSLV